MQLKSSRNKYGGFTLIELLVVISIISILTSIILTNVAAARKKANDARRIGDVTAIVTALELYQNSHGHYLCSKGELSSWPHFLQTLVDEKLLPKIIADPINQGAYVYWYDSHRAYPGGPCGGTVEINYDMEIRGGRCLFGGQFIPIGSTTSAHCHVILQPLPPPCTNPYLDETFNDHHTCTLPDWSDGTPGLFNDDATF